MAHTHNLYQPSDFTPEQYHDNVGVARMVIDGGLGICKDCGAGESQLDDWPTCGAYIAERDRIKMPPEPAFRGQFWVDLADVLDNAEADRPYILMDNFLDRLILRVSGDPADTVVVTPHVTVRDLLSTPERNPQGLRVVTDRHALDNGFFQTKTGKPKTVVLLGHSRIGCMRNQFYRAFRNVQLRLGGRVVCIDASGPPLHKTFAVASALGKARSLFGNYPDFVATYCDVTRFGRGVNRVEVRPKQGELLRQVFLKAVDRRFTNRPAIHTCRTL